MSNPKNAKNTKKYVENVIKFKHLAEKEVFKRNLNKDNIVLKCNKKLSKNTKKDAIILNKINEFNTNGKKTIAYFIDSFYPVIDGVVSVLDNYAKFMSKYFNVVICSPKHKKKTYESDDYFVLSANSMHLKGQGYDLGFPQFDNKFQNFLSLLKIDLVHVNAPFSMGSFGLEIAKKRKIPSITTFHSQFRQDFQKATNSESISKILSNIIIKIYDKSTVTLTMNKFSYGIMRKYGLKRRDVKIVPNATNLVYKNFDDYKEREVLKQYKIKKEIFTMIFIGRFVKVKNVYLILDTLKELFKINKNFQFIFLGYGPEEDKMKKIIKENHLEKNIIFTGKILDSDEKAIIIKNSNLLFFPSDYDTDGIVKIECACYSVPTLCLAGTGVASGLDDNETGFLENNDISCLVKRIDELSKNVDLVEKVGKNAKEKIYVTWEDVGNRLLKIYNDLINKKSIKRSRNKKEKIAGE